MDAGVPIPAHDRMRPLKFNVDRQFYRLPLQKKDLFSPESKDSCQDGADLETINQRNKNYIRETQRPVCR
jgi:hypothetical protein